MPIQLQQSPAPAIWKHCCHIHRPAGRTGHGSLPIPILGYLRGQSSPGQQPQNDQVQETTHRHPPERDERHITTNVMMVVVEVYVGAVLDAVDETAVGVGGPGRLPT